MGSQFPMYWLMLLALFAGAKSFSAPTSYESEGQNFKFQVLTTREDVVWGFDFLDAQRIIFTERGGKMGILDLKTKTVTDIKGVPTVWNHGQGGLLDVRVSPKNSQKIFFTYSDPVGQDRATTSLATAMLKNGELTQFKKLFTAIQPNSNEIHFGSRIEFDVQAHVFITVGDRNEREHAQSLKFHQGKVLRLNQDGSVPRDNPFAQMPDALPEIWTLGHRSPQGLARHPMTGELWMSEMGPRGGDEINLVKPGKNYGWPKATFGREYHGPKIGETSAAGTEHPVAHWVPSISPSGMTFYSGKVFHKWKGNAFLANLSGQHIRRIVLDKTHKVVKEEELLKDAGLRFRNVRTGPDGFLYVSTDDGKIARIE